MIDPLRRVLVKRPDEVFASADPQRWRYAGRPDLDEARREHDEFAAKLRSAGAEVLYHDEILGDLCDAIYVFDPLLMTNEGAVLLNMGKDLRRGEEASLGRRIREAGVPLIGGLEGEARAEGGDLLWLDEATLAVGLGFRTNAAGLESLRRILSRIGVDVLPAELPYHEGPASCLHLLSLISLVDEGAAVVFPPLLPVPFWERLRALGFRLIPVPPEEFPTMGPNVLALAPGRGAPPA
jgi:N-dimethylarginine dimethylaminohydrolase